MLLILSHNSPPLPLLVSPFKKIVSSVLTVLEEACVRDANRTRLTSPYNFNFQNLDASNRERIPGINNMR